MIEPAELGALFDPTEEEIQAMMAAARQRQKLVAEKRWNMPGVANAFKPCRWISNEAYRSGDKQAKRLPE